MKRIKFTIPCEVLPKQADRSRIMTTPAGAQFIAHYSPSKIVQNRHLIAGFIQEHIPLSPLMGPLRLHVMFAYVYPKSISQKRRANGPIPKDTKPDCDNLFKQLADVLEACGFFAGDQQIADGRCQKFWWEKPGVHVLLEQIEPGEIPTADQSVLEFAGAGAKA